MSLTNERTPDSRAAIESTEIAAAAAAGENPSPPAAMPVWMRLLTDFGPLLVFFGSYYLWGIFSATLAFMVAQVAAILVCKLKTGAISPLLWFTTAIVVVFGGLTLYLRDETFIKLKPTIIYVTFAAILFFGLWRRQPVLKLVLGDAYPALDDIGWTKLTRNWALFFTAMALTNELVWRTVSTDLWVQFKVWGVTIISILFALTQAPLMIRHSLDAKKASPEA